MKKIDKHWQSILKSVIWRIMGVLVLALITFLVTRNWIQTSLITFIHHAVFLIVYYLHERLWIKIEQKFEKISKYKKWIRPITYEIILGHLILGLITLCVTGSWLSVTLVTPIYIWNKLWMYLVYDWIWKKALNK